MTIIRRPLARRRTRTVSAYTSAVTATTTVSAATIVLPTDANVINAQTAPYGILGNGTHDDTAGINALLDAYDWLDAEASHTQVDRSCPRIIFFPAGTYRLTGTIGYAGSSLALIGAGEGQTIFKLDDNASGFASKSTPKYLLVTGNAGTAGQENAGFSNYIQFLTLDVGAGNPGAVGCRYSVANAGHMRHVTIKSSDPDKVGQYGLMFGTSAGPGICSDITIDGFDYGVHTQDLLVNDIVLARPTFKNQRIAAIDHGAKSLAVENLTAQNVPMVLNLTDNSAAITIAGGTFTGSDATKPALQVVDNSYMWARDVTATGFANIVTQGATARFVGSTFLREWATVPFRRGNTSVNWTESNAYVSPRLPIASAPEYNSTSLFEWTKPQVYPNYSSTDVGPALQSAIDSGAKVVYLPYGKYTINTPVIVRGAVVKIDFMFSLIGVGTNGSLTVGDPLLGDISGPSVILEHFSNDNGLAVVHNSAKTVVMRDMGNASAYTQPFVTTGANATGDLFIESKGANSRVEISQGVNVWIRQLNRERAAHAISGGARVWMLGDNIELHSNYVDADTTISGGSTLELLGGTFDVLDFPSAYPTTGKAAYAATGTSTLFLALPASYRGTTSLGHWVSDLRSGASVGDVDNSQVFHTNTNPDRLAVTYVSPP